MDLFWYILSLLFVVGGVAGCILPVLPGPPVSYVALLILQLTHPRPFTSSFLIIFGIIALLITILDYAVPMLGARKHGGSKYGIWGCSIGIIIGLFFPPWGIIMGPFIGAFFGELFSLKGAHHAFRAAWGSFIGFLFGILIKLVFSFVVIFYYIKSAMERMQL